MLFQITPTRLQNSEAAALASMQIRTGTYCLGTEDKAALSSYKRYQSIDA